MPNSRYVLIAGCILTVLLGAALLSHVADRRVQDRVMRADPEVILSEIDLADKALQAGKSGFEEHCASCHGSGRGDPARGIPDLTDGDYLYGSGRVAEIEQIVLHGIRSGDPRGWDLASMPAYARARPYSREPIPPLSPEGLEDVTQYILSLHNRSTARSAVARGQFLFKGNGACWDCHGGDAGGDNAIGASNLLDDVWLYGDGSAASISRSIAHGRAGISPAFARKLSPFEARAIAVFVASLSRKVKAK